MKLVFQLSPPSSVRVTAPKGSANHAVSELITLMNSQRKADSGVGEEAGMMGCQFCAVINALCTRRMRSKKAFFITVKFYHMWLSLSTASHQNLNSALNLFFLLLHHHKTCPIIRLIPFSAHFVLCCAQRMVHR